MPVNNKADRNSTQSIDSSSSRRKVNLLSAGQVHNNANGYLIKGNNDDFTECE